MSRSLNSGCVDRPLDAYVGVVPGDAGLGRRVVGAGQLVGDVGHVAEHGEAVGEADRDEELAVALVVELVSLPLAVGGRAAAQVDGDVEDPPARAAHQLRLARLGLEVQAAQRPLRGARVVLLDELDLDPELGPAVAPEGLDHEAARVAVDVGLEQDDAVELRLQPPRHQPQRFAVLLLVVLAVLAGADRLPPLLVLAVPVDGPLEALGEVDLRLPAQLAASASPRRASSGGRGRGGR